MRELQDIKFGVVSGNGREDRTMNQCDDCRSVFSVVGLDMDEQFMRVYFCKHKEKVHEPWSNHARGECAEFIGTHRYLRIQKQRAKEKITWRNSKWHENYTDALIELGVKSPSNGG